jgi:hypothetical protein
MAIPLGQTSLPGSSDLPESRTERAAPPLLFGLAPHGVYPAGTDYSGRGALLPHLFTLTRDTSSKACATGGIFSVALSVKPALSESPRPLAGMLPCGDRTFLPLASRNPPPSGHPSNRPIFIVSGGSCAREPWRGSDSLPAVGATRGRYRLALCVRKQSQPDDGRRADNPPPRFRSRW